MAKQIKSILFLPFLQIASGHHQAANAIIEGVQSIHPDVKCEKIDILSYSYGKVESLVSNVYLNWIQAFPGIYNVIYQHSVYKNIEETKRYRLYEILFLFFIKKLVQEQQPDLIVCTHALPAYMLNHLKKRNQLNIPVVNVYTDYFIHRFWGIEEIDFHFVPSDSMRRFLSEKGISEDRIFITGIPIHKKMKTKVQIPLKEKTSLYTVLVSGGSLGVGAIEKLIDTILEAKSDRKIQFYVLCGQNKRLFEKLNAMGESHIIPFSYIDCMEKMSSLYDQIDAIITKPGGVTISESLYKRVPIFIYHALPGQEKINLEQLKGLGVVYQLEDNDNIQDQILSVLNDPRELDHYQKQVARFHTNIHTREPAEIIADLLREVH